MDTKCPDQPALLCRLIRAFAVNNILLSPQINDVCMWDSVRELCKKVSSEHIQTVGSHISLHFSAFILVASLSLTNSSDNENYMDVEQISCSDCVRDFTGRSLYRMN